MKMAVLRGKRYFLKPFVTLFLIYLVAIFAIILANVHYADDIARTNIGYAGWSTFSRYLSTFLAHGLHADNYLANIAPLPQVLAAAVLAFSSVIVIYVVSGEKAFEGKWTNWILKVVAVVPLGLCPYMLECLSYQYDAVYMALSVFFAVMPLLFYKKSKWLYGFMLAVGTLGVCMTYQASIGILPMLVIYITIKNWNAREDSDKKSIEKNLKFVLISAAVFVVSLLIFQKLLMRPKDMYVSNAIPSITEFFPSLFSHLAHYLELLFSDFKILWLVLSGFIIIGFVATFVDRSKRNKFLAFLIAIFGAGLMFLMSYLFYSALETPLYTTRAMYAVGAFIAIIGVHIASVDKIRFLKIRTIDLDEEVSVQVKLRLEIFFIAATAILSWCFFSFSFVYGNALNEQNTYRNTVINMVLSDVNEILPTLGEGEKYIQSTGQIDFAPAVLHMPTPDFDLVRRLLKPSFGGDVYWMAYRLTEASGVPGLKFDPLVDFREKNLPLLRETALYNIYGNKEGVLVDFKGVSFQETVNE